MNNTSTKKFIEGFVKVSEDKSRNQVQLTFGLSKNNDKTITLVGNGSIKILTPVL